MAKRRTKKARSEAARKGWVTRRKREAARKRELARKRRKRRTRVLPPPPPKRKRRRGGVVIPPPPPPPPPPPEEPPDFDEPFDYADEWEIGFEYRSSSGGGANAAVDVNIRIAREDGHAFGPVEAQRVLREFQESLLLTGSPEIPAGYMLATIDWHRPRWGTNWQSGTDVDLDAFRNPMMVEADNPSAWTLNRGELRLGSVKR